MGSIIYNPNNTRKNGLPILGEGCINCQYKDKCLMEHCNIAQYIRYKGCSELTSAYKWYREDLGFETYVRKYKYGYFLLVKGEKYKSGEIDNGWYIHFYKEDMSNDNHGISNQGVEIDKSGKRYLYIKNIHYNYSIRDMIPLENSSLILH